MEEKQPYYFLHIPKTAGTTFRVFLENRFSIDRIFPAYEFFGLKGVSDWQLKRYQLYRGHMGFNLANYLPLKPHVLVMLRDPMERAVSHFEYIKRDPKHPKFVHIQEHEMELRDFLLHPQFSAELRDAQTRPLAHIAQKKVLARILKDSRSQMEFARRWQETAKTLPPADELLAVAAERLEQMAFVGLAERLEEGLQMVSWLLGGRPQPQVQNLNINPRRTRVADLPTDTLELLEEVTELDRKLYARAQQLFEARYREMVNSLLEQRQQNLEEIWQAPPGDVVVDFSSPLQGTGWHQREIVPGKGLLRWTGPGTVSDLDVLLDAGKDYQLTIHIEGWANEEILRSLALSVNGETVQMRLKPVPGENGVLCNGMIKRRMLKTEQPYTRLVLRTSSTAPEQAQGEGISHNYSRLVGVAISHFEFRPLK